VRKLVGENTRFIHGLGGELIAEFDGTNGSLKKEYVYGGGTLATIEPTAVNSNGTQYATVDSLGSPRVITNSSANVVSRHDYLPFGEELFAGTGGRTTAQGYVGDNVRQKFTDKERDAETGLDYFGARYYGNTQGRFTSPDPLLASGRPLMPQSWNRYTYVLNNPVRLIDPNGLLDDDDLDEQQAKQQRQQPTPPPQPPSTNVVVDTFELGSPPPPIPKGGGPVPARAEIKGTLEGDDQRRRPYSYVNLFGIQETVVLQVTDQNGKPYYTTNSEGIPASVDETVTKVPGSVEAPAMKDIKPETRNEDLQPGGIVGDKHSYNPGPPDELPNNLNAVRRQVISVVDPNTFKSYDVGHFEIRYTKTQVIITDYTRGKENAKTYTWP